MPLLNVALVPAPDQVVVRVTGEADLSCAPRLVEALARAGGMGTRHVVVDLGAVRFWDLSGLRALADFTSDLAAERRSCRIVGAPAATRRLIQLACLGDELNLDGPIRQLPTPREPAPPRRPVPEHAVSPRVPAVGELVAVGGAAASPGRRPWRRRG